MTSKTVVWYICSRILPLNSDLFDKRISKQTHFSKHAILDTAKLNRATLIKQTIVGCKS